MGPLLLLLLMIPARAHVPAEELQRMVDELAPLVEQVAGRSFDRMPEVILASPDTLGEALFREQVHLLVRRSQLSSDQAEAAASRAASSLADAFVGKYGFLDKRLYVLEGGVDHALSRRGLDPALAGPVLEVILAHELTHALQDQHRDLGEVAIRQADGDGVMAANCVVEGHAVWVHEQVGALRGHPEAVDLVADFHGYDRGSPHLSDSPDRFYTSYVYGQGRAFVAWHAGGTGQLWRILDAPPATSAMILSPETYTPDLPDGQDPVLEALRHARSRLAPTRRAWTATDERIGDFHLREYLLERLGAGAQADEVQRGWRSRASDPRRGRGIDIRAFTFRSEQAARHHVHQMRRAAATQLELLLPPSTSPLHRDLRGEVLPFEALEADAAAREVLHLDLGEGRQVLSTLWIARGPHVLHLSTVNLTPSDRRLARTLDRLFHALE